MPKRRAKLVYIRHRKRGDVCEALSLKCGRRTLLIIRPGQTHLSSFRERGEAFYATPDIEVREQLHRADPGILLSDEQVHTVEQFVRKRAEFMRLNQRLYRRLDSD